MQDAVAQSPAVLDGVGVPAVLHGADAQEAAGRRLEPGRRIEGTVADSSFMGGRAREGEPDGTCWVMQCTPPPPWARVTPGTATTSRPG